MEKVLSKHDGPKDLNSLVGMHLYVAVLLQEETGTHTTTTHPQPHVYITNTHSHAQVCSPLLTPPLSGGLNQEAEFAAVKFVKSPYSLSLVSTPPFIKPGLPYNIQVCVALHQV